MHLFFYVFEILTQPAIATRFQDVGTDGNGFQSAGKNVGEIETIGSGRKGDVEFTAEIPLQFTSKINAYGMQSSTAHIHHLFVFRKDATEIQAFEGIRELDGKMHLFLFCRKAEVADNAKRIGIFQVVFKSKVGNGSGIAEGIIQNATQLIRTKQGGIQLDGSMQAFLFNKI